VEIPLISFCPGFWCQLLASIIKFTTQGPDLVPWLRADTGGEIERVGC
jgi:hypothetical protein